LLKDLSVQNGDTPLTVTVLLVAADPTGSSSASVSSAMTVGIGSPGWQARFVDAVASRARAGAVRLGAQLAPAGASRERRFVPLAAVVPTAHVAH
jgi:hypothetical protein